MRMDSNRLWWVVLVMLGAASCAPPDGDVGLARAPLTGERYLGDLGAEYTWISDFEPNVNYESDDRIEAASFFNASSVTERRRGLIRLNATALDLYADSLSMSGTLLSAELVFEGQLPCSIVDGSLPGLLELRHAPDASWTADGATWNCTVDDFLDSNDEADCLSSEMWSGASGGALISSTDRCSDGERKQITFDVTEEIRRLLDGPAENAGWVLSAEPATPSGELRASLFERFGGPIDPVRPLLRLTFVDDTYSPPDDLPAPPLDRSTVTSIWEAYRYLVESETPLQWPVVDGTIDPQRAALVRGYVRDHEPLVPTSDPEAPVLSGVDVTVLGHPEYGRARSNSTGLFRLLVNGGGSLVLEYRRDGYLLAQRRVEVPYDGHVLAPDVAMVRTPDPSSCEAISGANRVAEVTDETDARGHRALRVYVPSGVVLDGIGSDFHLCARERTVEPRTDGSEPVLDGEAAMVGELPPTSNYTFAAAVVARTSPSTPDVEPARFLGGGVTLWLENLIGLPEGETVPYGTYDPAIARWVPGPNGTVVTVTRSGVSTCAASPAVADSTELSAMCARLGLSVGESASFWRVPNVSHFSEIDLNYLLAIIEGLGAALRPAISLIHSMCGVGSTVFCESQALGETLGLPSAPFALTYSSLRQRGREDAYRLTMQVFGPDVEIPPADFLQEVIVEVHVAGRRLVETRRPPFAAGQEVTVIWDGLDAERRPVQGPQRAEVRVGYRFNARYVAPAPGDGTFGRSGSRDEVSVEYRGVVAWSGFTTSLGVVDDRLAGIGGWNLDVHHVYDPDNGVVWLGDGSRFGVEESGLIVSDAGAERTDRIQITTVAALSDGALIFGSVGEGLFLLSADESTEIRLCTVPAGSNELELLDVATGPSVGGARPDVFFLNANTATVRRIRATDTLGRACASYGAVVGSRLNTILDDEVPADDGLTGLIRTSPATIELGQLEAISAASDGSLYIAERTRERVLRWSEDGTPDGLLELVAGRVLTDAECPITSRSPLCQRGPTGPLAVAPDGAVYFVRSVDDVSDEILRLDRTGRFVESFAGRGADVRDGGRLDVLLSGISALAVHPDGRLFLAHGALPGFASERVRAIGLDGEVRTVAGLRRICEPFEAGCRNYDSGSSGAPATATGLTIAADVAVNGGRRFWVADGLGGRRRPVRVDPLLSDTRDDDHVISSPDGAALWVFDRNGRHLRTLDALTGTVLVSFDYLEDGRLQEIVDVEGRTFAVRWPASESSGTVSFEGPGLAASLALDSAGYARELSYTRAGFTDRTTLAHGGTGLLSSLTDPDGDLHTFAFEGGLLTSDAVPGYAQTLETVCPSADASPDCRVGETRVRRRLGSGADEIVTTHSTRLEGGVRISETDLPNGLHSVLEVPLDGNASTISVCPGGRLAPAVGAPPCRPSCTPEEAAAGTCVQPYSVATAFFEDDPRPERANTRFASSSRIDWRDEAGNADGYTFTTAARFDPIDSSDDTAIDRYRAADTIGTSAPSIRTEEHLIDGGLRHMEIWPGEAEPTTEERAEYHPERRWSRVISDPEGRPVRIEEPGRHPVCIAWDGFHVREVRQAADDLGGTDCARTGPRRTSTSTWDAATRYLTRHEVRTSASGSLATGIVPDEMGRPITTTLPGSERRLTTSFDADGFLDSIIVPAGRRHDFGDDAMEAVVSYTPPAVPGYPSAPAFTTTYGDSSLASEIRLRAPGGSGTEGIVYFYEDAPLGVDGVGADVTRVAGPTLTFSGPPETGGEIATHWSGEFESVTDGRTRVDRAFRGPLMVAEAWSGTLGLDARVERSIDGRLMLDAETVTIGVRRYEIDHTLRDDGSLERSSLGGLDATYSYELLADLDPAAGAVSDPGTRLCAASGTTTSTTVIDGFGEPASRVMSIAGDCAAPELSTAPYQLRDIQRDDAGRIIGRTERRLDPTQPPPSRCLVTTERYSYDSTGRLAQRTAITRRCAGPGLPRSVTATYAYDANGNRAGGANEQDQPIEGRRRYDARGRLRERGVLERFTHDEYDRMTRWSRPGAAAREYDYDPFGRLVRTSSGGVTSERFYYRDTWLPIAWQRRVGGNFETWIFQYGHLAHVPDLAWVDTNSDGTIDERIRFVTDERGSVVMLLDADDGTVLANWSYDPWGVRTGSGRAQPFGFAGGFWLDGPELWHMGARNLDPTIGRFTTADPIGFAGGLNHYEYAGSDPINSIDPTGLAPISPFGGGMASIGVCTAMLLMYGGDAAIAAQNIIFGILMEMGIGLLPGAARGAMGRLGTQCFAEGTPVESEDGLVPIEDIAEGDLVWSRDPETGEEGLHRVTRTFVRSAPVMELEVIGDDATDVFVVTGEHPFWRRDLEGGGWVRAQDLLPGDEVFTSRGGWARIGSGTWLSREQLVYNFEVEGSHTYFVGETGTWVHNQCLPGALRGGPSNVSVYYGLDANGHEIYIGITNDVARREAQHGSRFTSGLREIASGLTRGEARAIEQAGIVRAGGAFENRINSISPRHAYYRDAVRWGENWLRSRGL